MSSAQYIVEVDFDRDESYGNALSDITQYVKDMRWRNGMSKPEMEVASPTQLSLTLDNAQGDFNIEESGSTFEGLFKRGQLIRVRAVFSSTTYTLFTGKLQLIPTIDPKNYGTHEVTVTADDLMDQLLDLSFVPDLLVDATVDEALQHVFDKAAVVLPYHSSYWMLNYSGSALGTNTYLVDTDSYVNFETAKSTLAFVGDNTGSDRSTRVQQYIRDMVAAEGGGRFWFDGRSGTFKFHNRHHDVNPTSVYTLTGSDYLDGKYVAQSNVINRITANYTPRELGAYDTVLWASDRVITLGSLEEKTIIARYRDINSTSVRVGGKDILPPSKGFDYIANRSSDGTGQDATPRLLATFEPGAAETRIHIANKAQLTIYVTTLQVRGTPIKAYQRQSVEVIDEDSIYTYDPRNETITLTAVDDISLAEGIAGNRLSKHKDPHTYYENVRLIANKTDTLMTQALTRTVGDTITVQHDDIGHDTMYVIVGEDHRVTGGGDHTHEVTWTLKTNDYGTFWVLNTSGYSELSETTYLTF